MSPTYIDALVLLIIKDKHILATRTRGKDKWYIPGGKRKGNESDVEALIRELKEELSIDLIPETIKPYGTFEAHAHGFPIGTFVRMVCFMSDFSGEIKPDAEIEAVQYVDSHDFTDLAPGALVVAKDLLSKKLIR